VRTKAGMSVRITMPELEKVDLSGACTGNLKGFKNAKHLTIELSGASKLDGDITAEDLDIHLSGARGGTLRGKAGDAKLEGSGAKNLHLEELAIDKETTNLRGASKGKIDVSGKLDYDVSGASHLDYHGHPTLGSQQSSGASSATAK